MTGTTTPTDSGLPGGDPYRLARVLVFDVYEKTRVARPEGHGAELRRAAVSTANSLLSTARPEPVVPRPPVSERHRRQALEGLEHLSHWLTACVEDGSLSVEQRRELDGLRLGLLAALEPAND